MKRNILFLVLLLSLFGFSFSQSLAMNISETRTELLEMKQGKKLVEKIDKITMKIIKKSEKNKKFGTKILKKIQTIKNTYSSKKDTKSTKITLILSYLEERVSLGFPKRDTHILERFQRIESQKYSAKSKTRVNTIKKKKYERIHIKNKK